MKCDDCGMEVTPTEYHPYEACQMYVACFDAQAVRKILKEREELASEKTVSEENP